MIHENYGDGRRAGTYLQSPHWPAYQTAERRIELANQLRFYRRFGACRAYRWQHNGLIVKGYEFSQDVMNWSSGTDHKGRRLSESELQRLERLAGKPSPSRSR
jgi:hypothetical protein